MWRTSIDDVRRKVCSSTPHAACGWITHDRFHVGAGALLSIRFTVSTPKRETQRCHVRSLASRELHHHPKWKRGLAPQHADDTTIPSHRVRLPVWEPRQLDHPYDPPALGQSSQCASEVTAQFANVYVFSEPQLPKMRASGVQQKSSPSGRAPIV